MKEQEDLKDAINKLVKLIDENPCGMGRAMFWVLAQFLKEAVKFLRRKRYLSSDEAASLIDVTYTIEGKNYTDAVEITACMFPTSKPGAISLIATDKEPIIREVKATLKRSEDYLKSVEVEVPKNRKRVDDCKTLISLLDTEFAEKQEFENRIKKLEEGIVTTNKLLNQILAKLK